MATYILTAGEPDILDLFPTLGVDDVVVSPAGATSGVDIDRVDGFETFDKVDISAFPTLTAQMLVDEAVAIVGGVRIETPFFTLTLPGITKGQLTVDNFIEDGQNGPPIAVDDTATTIAGSAIDIQVLANDTDANDDPLSIPDSGFATTSMEGGTVTLNDNDTPDDGNDDFLSYSPAAGFTGTDSFSYSITDGEFTDIATVTVTVEANITPEAADDNVRVVANEVSVIPVLLNDSDLNASDILSVSQVGPAANGTVDIVEGQVSYTPNTDFTGTDSFTYTIEDSQGATDVATVNIVVALDNDTLTGTSQADLLIGDEDLVTRERINGNDGDDIIIGGRGADILSGGAGADQFIYRSLADSGANPDTDEEDDGDNIIDFDPTMDTIVLDFEIAPGIKVSESDVVIGASLINFGLVTIALNATDMAPDFLPTQFTIDLSGENLGTDEEQILNSIQFGTI